MMRIYNFLKFTIVTSLLCCVPMNATAKTDDNVVITQQRLNITFALRKGETIVKTEEQTFYEAQKMGKMIQPGTLYGGVITLDDASASGDASKAQYKSITPDNIFFDDTKVCFFNINLRRSGKKANVSFKRTFNDVRHFTRVVLSNEFLTQQLTVRIVIPVELNRYRIEGVNMPAGAKVVREANGRGDSIITYTLTNLPAIERETAMPNIATVYPTLNVLGGFANLEELYSWKHEMLDGVDTNVTNMPKMLEEITNGCSSQLEKAKAVYEWVQDNIRYVAFESGKAGFVPDAPSEVIRKGYGDCKGMSMLLRTMLRAMNMDARLMSIGTDDVAFRISNQLTLGTTNHMVCILYLDGKQYVLDATGSFFDIESIPDNIQGCDGVIEEHADYKIHALPILPPSYSTDSLHIKYDVLSENNEYLLKGKITSSWSGDMKVSLLNALKNVETQDLISIEERVIGGKSGKFKLNNLEWEGRKSSSQQTTAMADMVNSGHITTLEDELYIELDSEHNRFISVIDTTERTHDYILPMRCRIVAEVELTIPAGKKVTHLPQGISITTTQGVLSCAFVQRKGKVVMHKIAEISNKHIKRSDIDGWNLAVRKWLNACREQVVLK